MASWRMGKGWGAGGQGISSGQGGIGIMIPSAWTGNALKTLKNSANRTKSIALGFIRPPTRLNQFQANRSGKSKENPSLAHLGVSHPEGRALATEGSRFASRDPSAFAKPQASRMTTLLVILASPNPVRQASWRPKDLGLPVDVY